ALKTVNVDENTPDPKGGKYDRDPTTGRLTGHIREAAKDVMTRAIPFRASRDQMREGAKLISKMMSRSGITSVHDASGTPQALHGYQDAFESGDLLVRVYCMIWHDHLDTMLAAGVRTGIGNEWVRIGGIKMLCDGSISERTARLAQPYVGKP